MNTTTHRSIEMEMDEILAEIYKIARNLFVENHVTLPEISTTKLKLLNISLYYTSVPGSVRKIYCVTAGLVQMGLDLHEDITNHKEPTDKSMRNRQLSILAGDYYSSNYYSLLAENNLMDDIKILASAIRDINIAKMKLYTDSYETTFSSIKQFTDLIKIKESSLYTQFLDKYYIDKENKLWKSIIEDMIFLNQLSLEQQTKFIKKSDFTFYLINYFVNFDERNESNQPLQPLEASQNKLNYLYHKYDIHHKIDDMITGIYNGLIIKIKEIDNRYIQNELTFMLSLFSSSFQVFKVVEKKWGEISG